MSPKYVIFLILLFISVVVNFGMSKKIIDQIQLVTAVGYDYVDGDKIKGTVVTPSLQVEGQLLDLIYTTEASTLYEMRAKLNAQASEELFIGKLEVALFNDELARHGIRDNIDYLLRDPNIGTRIYLGNN